MGNWRLIIDTPRSGSFNMAADQVLLDLCRDYPEPVFRLYDWECPTLSLGKNEKLDSLLDLQECQNLSIPVVRRMTGGNLYCMALILHIHLLQEFSTVNFLEE